MPKAMSIEEFQIKIDEKYGENVWKVLEYKGLQYPCKVQCCDCKEVFSFKGTSLVFNKPVICIHHKLKEYQDKLDEKYGSGKWKALEYKGYDHPGVVKCLECGKSKPVTYAKNALSSNILCECNTVKYQKEKEKEIKRSITPMDKLQNWLDNKYGKNVWRIVSGTNSNSPVVIEHKCGEQKPFTRASTLKRLDLRCEECEGILKGRPKKTFEDLDAEIKTIDPDYELVDIIDTTNIIVKHKLCGNIYPTSTYNMRNGIKLCKCK